jgi:hypothetical protein
MVLQRRDTFSVYVDAMRAMSLHQHQAASSRHPVIADANMLPIARMAAMRTPLRGFHAQTERLVWGRVFRGDVRKLRIPDLRVFRRIGDSGLVSVIRCK